MSKPHWSHIYFKQKCVHEKKKKKIGTYFGKNEHSGKSWSVGCAEIAFIWWGYIGKTKNKLTSSLRKKQQNLGLSWEKKKEKERTSGNSWSDEYGKTLSM